MMNASPDSSDNMTLSTIILSRSKLQWRNLTMGTVGVVFNITALFLLWLSKRIRLSLKLALMSLTLNDLFIMADAVFWGLGFECWPILYIISTSIVVSYFMTSVLAVHNYVAVYYPLKCRQILSLSKSLVVLASCWLGGHIIGLACLGIHRPAGASCFVLVVMSRPAIVVESLVCLLCCCVITFMNVRVLMCIRRRSRLNALNIPPRQLCEDQLPDSSPAATRALSNFLPRSTAVASSSASSFLGVSGTSSNDYITPVSPAALSESKDVLILHKNTFAYNKLKGEKTMTDLPPTTYSVNSTFEITTVEPTIPVQDSRCPDNSVHLSPNSNHFVNNQSEQLNSAKNVAQTKKSESCIACNPNFLQVPHAHKLWPKYTNRLESACTSDGKCPKAKNYSTNDNLKDVHSPTSMPSNALGTKPLGHRSCCIGSENFSRQIVHANSRFSQTKDCDEMIKNLSKKDFTKHINTTAAVILGIGGDVKNRHGGSNNYLTPYDDLEDRESFSSANICCGSKETMKSSQSASSGSCSCYQGGTCFIQNQKAKRLDYSNSKAPVDSRSDKPIDDEVNRRRIFQIHEQRSVDELTNSSCCLSNIPSHSKDGDTKHDTEQLPCPVTDIETQDRSKNVNNCTSETCASNAIDQRQSEENRDTHESDVGGSKREEHLKSSTLCTAIDSVSAQTTEVNKSKADSCRWPRKGAKGPYSPNESVNMGPRAMRNHTAHTAITLDATILSSPNEPSCTAPCSLTEESTKTPSRSLPSSTTTAAVHQISTSGRLSSDPSHRVRPHTSSVDKNSRWRHRTQHTLLILCSWCCFLTLPYIIYGSYVAIWVEQRETFIKSGMGMFCSTLIALNSITNPLLYAWRFVEWRVILKRFTSSR